VRRVVRQTAAAQPDAAPGGTQAASGPVAARWDERIARHPWRWVLGSVPVTAALWFSHMPSLLLGAQFYADDAGWYQTAYAQGPLLSLTHPAHGYFVLLQRLAASASLALPLVAAPTFFNIVALLVQVVGIAYLLSPRMDVAIPRLWVRVALAVLVLALPNAYDTRGNLTNSQWPLALIAFLVVFARPPRRRLGWLVDALLLVLSGLTGPYCLLLEPIVLWRWAHDRGDRHRLFVMLLVSACSVLQGAALVLTRGAATGSSGLAAGIAPLITMLGRQITLGLTAGAHGLNGLASTPLGDSLAVLAVLAAIPVAVCAWAGWRGPAILRAFCLFAVLELALALAAPSITLPQWPNLGHPADVTNFHPGGIRYFLYPLIAFATSLGWLVWRNLEAARVRRGRDGAAPRQPPAPALRALGGAATVGAGAILLLAAVNGVPRDWLYPPYLDEHWAAQVQRLESAPPGTPVVIPTNPRGWTMTLVAR
jgi:hypothetical protein